MSRKPNPADRAAGSMRPTPRQAKNGAKTSPQAMYTVQSSTTTSAARTMDIAGEYMRAILRNLP